MDCGEWGWDLGIGFRCFGHKTHGGEHHHRCNDRGRKQASNPVAMPLKAWLRKNGNQVYHPYLKRRKMVFGHAAKLLSGLKVARRGQDGELGQEDCLQQMCLQSRESCRLTHHLPKGHVRGWFEHEGSPDRQAELFPHCRQGQ